MENGNRLDRAVEPLRVLGLDAAARHGWVGVLLDEHGYADACVGAAAGLIAWAEPVSVVAIDIPLGSVAGGSRLADAAARRFVGARFSSVFSAPAREVLTALDFASANATLTKLGAPRLSQQAWALIPKMIEADTIAASDERLFEVHPEVSFRHLAGDSLPWSKKSWNGLLLRRQLLADAGVALPERIRGVKGVAADDVVDAAVAAWSARRIATGVACPLPDPPQSVDGRQVAIWY